MPRKQTFFDKLISALQDVCPDAGSGDLAAHIPNPFQGVLPGTYIDSGTATLSLGDGGEDGENIPLQPLLIQARGVEVIIAVDTVRRSTYFSRIPPVLISPAVFGRRQWLPDWRYFDREHIDL